MLGVIYIQRKVVTREDPVETRRYELVQRDLRAGDLTLQLVLRSTLQRIGERLDLSLSSG